MARSAMSLEPTAGRENLESLEARVQRLEHAVAALSDTQLMEDRVVERVVQRVAPPTNGGVLAGAARLFKGGRPTESAADPSPAAGRPAATAPSADTRPGWLVFEFVDEVRTMLRMWGDYRYRMTWSGRIVPLACIVLAVLSFFLIRLIPLVGGIADYIITIVLVVILYKSLSREARRYQSGVGRGSR